MESDAEHSVNMQACKYSELRHRDVPEMAYSFSMDTTTNSGILKVSSFGIMDMEAYFAFLDTTFLFMKQCGVPNLVVDLRGNQGGHPIFAAQLFSYLTDSDFTWFRRNQDVVEFEPLYNSMLANQNHFQGNIFVLVNGACLSTTGHLISQLKCHTGSLFIGEEPGSSFLCNDFSIQMQLPNSGIEVNIPRTTFVTAVTGFDEREPFHVDYQVSITVQDLLREGDSYRSKVSSLINEHSSLP